MVVLARALSNASATPRIGSHLVQLDRFGEVDRGVPALAAGVRVVDRGARGPISLRVRV